MPDKKIVDDYYSNIDSSWNNKEEWSSATKKIKIKPKKIIKKTSIKSEKVEDKKIKKKEIEKNIEEKVKPAIKKKAFVQTMSVVKEKKSEDKKEKKQTKASCKKRLNKKIDNWINSSNLDNINSNIKSWKKINTSNTKNNSISWDSLLTKKWKEASNSWNSHKKEQKIFWENKYKSTGNKKTFDWNKKKEESKKVNNKFSRGKTRGRFKFYTEDNEPKAFSRSNKINKKTKEEKKVEDITQNLINHAWETIVVPDILTIKELSEKIGVPFVKLIAEFMKNWMMVNINSKIDFDSASIISEEFEIKLARDGSDWLKVEELVSWNISKLLMEEDSSKLSSRPPVVSIMWHVDHWKTSLLDYIRKSNITTWEEWGITQSIWAYQVEHDNKKITFLDTPWHEAFTIMRARWAKATDIAILVVAADEWVKPQTIESISHAKEAWIPIIVAINKMDKEWANPDHVKSQLSENWLIPEDWGGDIPMVPISAHTGFGIDELLEIILLVAEMKELKANPNRSWVATVLESHLDVKLWPVATVLVNTWTLNKGDDIVCNDAFWKIKVLKNYENKWVIKSFPWDPVLIVWLDKVVSWGDILQVVSSPSIAKNKAAEYRVILQNNIWQKSSGLDILMSRIKAWNLKQLKILLKADTNGSLEAIKSSLQKLSTDETNVVIIHSWVWNITEWDVLMCESSWAILVWFSVDVIPAAKTKIENSKIEYINSGVIYHIIERIEKIVTWMLNPKEVEIPLCTAKVWGIFFTDKDFMILGLIINPWEVIESNTQVRVIRKDKIIGSWEISSLKHWVEEVKKLEWPIECWVKFEWNLSIEKWDKLEVYKIEIQK